MSCSMRQMAICVLFCSVLIGDAAALWVPWVNGESERYPLPVYVNYMVLMPSDYPAWP